MTATSPLSVTVAEAPRRIGKSLYWCAAGVPDGVWRDSKGPGEWRDPSALGLGKAVNIPKSYTYYQIDGEDTVDFRAKLRRDLTGTDRRALIMGALSESVQLVEARNSWKTTQTLPRNRKLFKDAPRTWLTLDCDDLNLKLHDPDIDVVAQADEMPDIIADIFDRCGLDWLIADTVMHFSSRFGLIDRHTFKAHIEWHLAKPLTLAEQKRVAAYCNSKTREAGYGEIFDLSIYTPEHLVFTAPALLQKRIWQPGKGIVEAPAEAMQIERVRSIPRGQLSIDVPGEALSLSASEKIARITGTKAKTKSTSLATDTKLVPGNIYNAVRARIYAAALKTPAHLAEARLADLRDSLSEKIIALPDNDAEKLERRLRYVSAAEMRRSWDAAIAKRQPWHSTFIPSQRTAHSPQAARAIVKKAASAFVHEAIERRDGIQRDPEALIQEQPKPIHLLMRVPPGIGKTHAALSAILPTHLTTQRINYLSPTVRLSGEAVARKFSTLDGDYLRSRVRHHKGRAQLCKSEEYGRLAERLEELGRSPVKDVCGRCPLRDACAWPAQHSDKESGLVAGQHAHATSSLAKLKQDSDNLPSFGIIDESLLSTMLAETQRTRSIAALRRASRKSTIRAQDGRVINSATTDLHAYRDALLSALDGARGKLSTSSVLHFSGQIKIVRGDASRIATRVDDATDMEYQVQRSYDAAFRAALNAYHIAKATNSPTQSAERRMGAASTQIKLSGWFLDAYRAVKASLEAKREYVFGITLTGSKVSLHLRAPMPAIFGSRSWIWLDGTASEPVWSALFHNTPAELQVLDIPVEPGAYHLTQYPDRPYGKGMFLNTNATTSLAGRENNLRRLHRFIAHTAAKHSPRTVLVVTQLPVRKALEQLPLPKNVALEHFNNLRGVDVYKEASAAIIVGRPLPPPSVLEAMTEALHYDNPKVQDIRHISRWAPSSRRGIRMDHSTTVAMAKRLWLERTGGGMPAGLWEHVNSGLVPASVGGVQGVFAVPALDVPCETHPDAQVELLRQQVVDAEVRQAINRLRLYDRTQDNHAEIHVFGQCDTGLPVHRLADWQDAERETPEILFASGIYSNSTSVVRRMAGGLLAPYEDRWVKEVVGERRISAQLPDKDIIRGAPAGRRDGNSISNCALIRLACANIGEWSVKIEGLAYAVRVWVDADRHGSTPAEVQTAVEYETGLKVLALWQGKEAAAHRMVSGAHRVGRGYGRSSGSLSRAVDPAGAPAIGIPNSSRGGRTP